MVMGALHWDPFPKPVLVRVRSITVFSHPEILPLGSFTLPRNLWPDESSIGSAEHRRCMEAQFYPQLLEYKLLYCDWQSRPHTSVILRAKKTRLGFVGFTAHKPVYGEQSWQQV